MHVDWGSANDAAVSALIELQDEINRRHGGECVGVKDDIAILAAAMMVLKVTEGAGRTFAEFSDVVQAVRTLRDQ